MMNELKVDTDFLNLFVNLATKINRENYGRVFICLEQIIHEQKELEKYQKQHKAAPSKYEYDTQIKDKAAQKVNEKMRSLMKMSDNFDKISEVQQAAMFMLLEKLCPGSVCTKEKIKVVVEKERIQLKDYIESTFPNISYEEAKATFRMIYDNNVEKETKNEQ